MSRCSVVSAVVAGSASILGSCRSVDEFEKVDRIGEGTYGASWAPAASEVFDSSVSFRIFAQAQCFQSKNNAGTVYKARHKETGQVVALKRVILHNEKADGVRCGIMYDCNMCSVPFPLSLWLSVRARNLVQFPITSLREMRTLQRLHHPNIVQLIDVVVGKKRESVFLAFEFCECDLASVIDARSFPFKEAEVKSLVRQLLAAVAHCHETWVVHRDLKMSNLLYKRGCLKLADFGLARSYGYPSRPSSPRVVTLWYRAPELLLGEENYTPAIDMWAVGCIFGEFLLHRPLLPGKTESEQLRRIMELLGAPNEEIWPDVVRLSGFQALDHSVRSRYRFNSIPRVFPDLSPAGRDLLGALLAYDPSRRISAEAALSHPYFSEFPPACPIDEMPSMPAARAAQRGR